MERLEEEAEKLQMKLELKGGGFRPFSRALRDQFVMSNEATQFQDGGGLARLLLRSSQRQLLLDHIIRASKEMGGAGLAKGQERATAIISRFPLHNQESLLGLKAWVRPWKSWGWSLIEQNEYARREAYMRAAQVQAEGGGGGTREAPGGGPGGNRGPGRCCALVGAALNSIVSQPLDKIADYYGEQVAFYYAFLEFYTKVRRCPDHVTLRADCPALVTSPTLLSPSPLPILILQWLIVPAILGILVIVHQFLMSDRSAETTTHSTDDWESFPVSYPSPYTPLYSIAICIWLSLMTAFWRPYRTELAFRFGVTDFELLYEPNRPEFTGKRVQDPNTGRIELVYPSWKRTCTLISSSIVLIAITLGQCALMLFLFE